MWVDRPLAIGKFHSPNIFAGFDAVHSYLSGFSATGITDPNHAKPGFLLTVLDPDNVPLLADVFDSCDTGAGAGYIDGSCLAGKWAPQAVHAPNANGELCRQPIINAASHVG